jgi:hypothetical protein
MAKGQWVKGKESALWAGAVPGLRPGMFRTFARVFVLSDSHSRCCKNCRNSG